jgi:putative phage-type endonuclease
LNEEEWLNRKKQGIGGSEISALLDVNPYKTPYQLWLDKTGRSPPLPDNKYLRAGKLMEPVIVEFFQQETNYEILKNSEENHLYLHPEHSFILGTPDRIYRDLEGKEGILECKNTRFPISLDNFPKSWLCQLQYYMGLTKIEQGEIAFLSQGVDFTHIKFEFVPEFYNYMIEKAVDFWEKHIQTDIPPPLETSGDVEKMFSSSVSGSIVTAAESTIEIISNLKKIREEISALSEKEKKIIEKIKMIMRDSEALTNGEEILITWKTGKNQKRIFLIK